MMDATSVAYEGPQVEPMTASKHFKQPREACSEDPENANTSSRSFMNPFPTACSNVSFRYVVHPVLTEEAEGI